MVRSCCSPSFSSSTGRPSGPTAFAFGIAFIAVAASSWSRGHSQRIAAGVSLGYRNRVCRISRSATSGRIAPISSGYALCRAVVSLPRHRRTAIRSSWSHPAAPISCFGRRHAGLSCTAASPIQRRSARRNERLLCCTRRSLQSITSMPDGSPQLRIPGVHFQALLGYVHLIGLSLQLSFRFGVSTPTLPWSPSLLGWYHQFSGPYDGFGECDFHAAHTAISWRV